jgi:1-phosphofructokinase family hexose kinase
VVNAGIAAHSLGGPSLTLAPLGGLPLQEFERQFAALGAPLRCTKTQTGTRVCTTLIDRATGKTTELVENGRPMSKSELTAFLQAYAEEAARADVAIITGSLPDGTPPSYYRDLLKNTPCPAVLDFRGEGLLGVLDLKPHIVKPNREELSQTLGMTLETNEQLVAAMRQLNRHGAIWTVVTDGPQPIWVSSVEKLYRFQPLASEKIVNPIGSGDAMAAGLAWAIREGFEIVRAVKFGIAAATENLTQLETCRLDRRRVENLAEKVLVEEVLEY